MMQKTAIHVWHEQIDSQYLLVRVKFLYQKPTFDSGTVSLLLTLVLSLVKSLSLDLTLVKYNKLYFEIFKTL